MIAKLPLLIDVVGAAASNGALITLLTELGADKNWRVRHSVLLMLPQLAAILPMDEFDAKFVAGECGFGSKAEDNCALIRHDWVLCVRRVVEQNNAAGYNQAWLKTAAVRPQS